MNVPTALAKKNPKTKRKVKILTSQTKLEADFQSITMQADTVHCWYSTSLHQLSQNF